MVEYCYYSTDVIFSYSAFVLHLNFVQKEIHCYSEHKAPSVYCLTSPYNALPDGIQDLWLEDTTAKKWLQ